VGENLLAVPGGPAIGASANVVVTGVAKRSGHPISFSEFTRYGVVVAAVTLVIATPYLLLRYQLPSASPATGPDGNLSADCG